MTETTPTVGTFPTAAAARADAEQVLADRPPSPFLVGRLRGGAGYVWCLVEDHRAVAAPGAPWDGMVVVETGRGGRQPVGMDQPAVLMRQETGIMEDTDGAWWIVVQSTYSDGSRQVQQFGDTGPDAEPIPFPDEDTAMRRAALASAHFRARAAAEGLTVIDGPGSRAERRAAARTAPPAEPVRGPVIDLDAPAAGLWTPGQ